MKSSWAVLLLLASCGDSGSLTELVLSADSDLTLDAITFEIAADGETTKTAQAARTSGPSYVSIVREHGTLGPVSVTARGMLQNKEVLHRTQVVEFVPGESLLVPLDLYARCVNALCIANQTCAANGCTPEKLQPSELLSWSGEPPTPFTHQDAGTPPGTGTGLTTCGTAQVDLNTDSSNCGECGHGCWLWENCAAGTCVLK